MKDNIWIDKNGQKNKATLRLPVECLLFQIHQDQGASIPESQERFNSQITRQVINATARKGNIFASR